MFGVHLVVLGRVSFCHWVDQLEVLAKDKAGEERGLSKGCAPSDPSYKRDRRTCRWHIVSWLRNQSEYLPR
jgi:hypothetical protein